MAPKAEPADPHAAKGLNMDITRSDDREGGYEPGRSVVVLGMHRSGTSVVTRIINLLGPCLCRSDDVVPGNPGNPAGHWESASLIKFNDRLLGMSGGSWAAPPPLIPDWETTPPVAALRGDGERVFMDAYPEEEWVWKDPRTCLTLPFWRTVWQRDPVAALVSREPLEVFLSLRSRNGLQKAHCIALWERYTRSAILSADGLPVVRVSYDRLMRDPASAVANLRADLAELGVRVHGNLDDAVRCVSTAYGRSRELATRLRADPDSTEAQRSLISFVESLPRISPKFDAPDLGSESSSTTQLLWAMRPYRPGFSAATREVWRAVRRTLMARCGHGPAPPWHRNGRVHRVNMIHRMPTYPDIDSCESGLPDTGDGNLV